MLSHSATTVRWKKKIGICDGESGPGRNFREFLDGLELGKKFLLLPNEAIIP